MKLSQKRMSRPSLAGIVATRQGAMALALVCALAATGILVFALGRYRASLKTTTPQATVLVATAPIAKGTSGDQIAARSLYRPMPIVSSKLSAGALSDASALHGTVAATSILPGQQLTAADFTTAAGVTGSLGPDQRAISLTVGEANGDTGILQNGDRVDVYAQLSKNKTTVELLILRGALVLQAPGSSLGGATKSATTNAGPLVLAVSSEQVPNVIYAAQNGQLYLTLRPTTASNTPSNITDLGSVFTASLNTSTTGAHP